MAAARWAEGPAVAGGAVAVVMVVVAPVAAVMEAEVPAAAREVVWPAAEAMQAWALRVGVASVAGALVVGVQVMATWVVVVQVVAAWVVVVQVACMVMEAGRAVLPMAIEEGHSGVGVKVVAARVEAAGAAERWVGAAWEVAALEAVGAAVVAMGAWQDVVEER